MADPYQLLCDAITELDDANQALAAVAVQLQGLKASLEAIKAILPAPDPDPPAPEPEGGRRR